MIRVENINVSYSYAVDNSLNNGSLNTILCIVMSWPYTPKKSGKLDTTVLTLTLITLQRYSRFSVVHNRFLYCIFSQFSKRLAIVVYNQILFLALSKLSIHKKFLYAIMDGGRRRSVYMYLQLSTKRASFILYIQHAYESQGILTHYLML